MVHCKEFWTKWRKEPNFCGLGKNTAQTYGKYLKFSERFCQEWGIPEGTFWLNAPYAAIRPLLKFGETSDLRVRAEREIATALRERKAVTLKYVNHIIGIDPTPRMIKLNGGMSTEIFDTRQIKDKIRVLNSILTTGQRSILLDIIKKEGLDNEYEALNRVILWASEKIK